MDATGAQPPQRAEGAAGGGGAANAADLFLRQLGACGIDYFFANGGTDFPPIVEAFCRAADSNLPMPRPMVVPHENAAVAMAHGVYMVTGRPQAVMVHVNVGSANTINALLDAGRDGTPVLLFAGKTPHSEGGRHGARTRYIHWAQEMFDQAGMLREAVKWDGELRLPEQAGDLVARAVQVAMTSPRGPVYATLPRDILAAPTDGATAVDMAARATPTLPYPDPAAIRQAAAWIAEAERPLVVTASAGRTAEGFAALSRLAERFALPVVEFHPRHANLSADHPMHAGFAPRPLLDDADLVLAVDCDVPWIPHVEAPPETCRVVHLAEDPAFQRYPMRSFRMDLAITAEVARGLTALEAALDATALDPARIAARAQRLTARLAARREPARAATAEPPGDGGGGISPEWLSRCIGEAVGEDALIVNEYPLRQDHCPRRLPGTYFGLSPAGGLGWGLGAALGAKLAAPEKLVVATLGDGAYIFANPTACHWVAEAHALPVLTVVFNNALYGALRNSTLAMYRDGAAASRDGGRMLAELGPAPAFEALVAASGGHGERVQRPEDVPAALARAVAAVRGGRQALLNVICDY
jgi:acetolactate synthase I/II/III large subunit